MQEIPSPSGGAQPAPKQRTHPSSVRRSNEQNLANGKDLSANVERKKRDVISVSAAQVVYVVEP